MTQSYIKNLKVLGKKFENLNFWRLYINKSLFLNIKKIHVCCGFSQKIVQTIINKKLLNKVQVPKSQKQFLYDHKTFYIL